MTQKLHALTPRIRKHGGWVHRGVLLDAGWKPHQVLAVRRAEGIDLIRRQWLVLPDAPEEVREAARLGGVLTGVSALERLRLWVPPELTGGDRIHIGLRADASVRPGPRTVTDRARPIAPRPPRELVDAVENVLRNVAVRLPHAQALAIWESAVRSELVTVEALQRMRWRSRAALALAAELTGLSDSGVETTFVTGCRRAGMQVVQQVWIAGKPVDALIGRRLVVQLDGYAFHSDSAQRRRDIAHDRTLIAMGYTVMRFSYQDVMHDWARVERELLSAIARGLAD